MSQIETVHARQILDSRGNPTVEVERRAALGRVAGAPRCRRARRPASTRPTSCATATTRGCGKGVTKAVGNVNGEIAEAVAGVDALDQAGARPRADRRSTARRTSRAWAPTRSSACRWRRARAAATEEGLPLWRYLGGEAARDPAGADDERAQRRRARRQLGRLPGVHDRAGRRAVVRRGPAHGRRGLPRAEEAAARPRAGHGVGDEGGFAPNLDVQRGGAGRAR